MATEVLEGAAGPGLTRRRATIEEFWSLPEGVLPAEYVDGMRVGGLIGLG
ncbi:MAG TPA: hypothetical protein VN228_13595 [Pyrinomonadaceae bacterium]|nr:hypothetical protein [Pyrinomonadaceae bacterium]